MKNCLILNRTKMGSLQYLVKLVETNQNKNIEFQKHLLLRSFWFLILILSLIILVLLTYFFTHKSKNKDLKTV